MKKHLFPAITISLTILLSGCTTKKLNLPTTPKEYTMSKKELIEKYPDIKTYESRWNFSFTRPSKDTLIEKLGDPDKIKRDWWTHIILAGELALLQAQPVVWGMVFLISPDTPKDYIYKKGDYCIKVHTLKNIAHLYKPTIAYWTWDKVGDKDCK